MALHFAAEPNQGSHLVRSMMAQLAKRKTPLSARALNFSALTLSQPHAVYDLRADTVASGGGLETATLSAFRYLIHSAGGVVAAAEVLVDASGNATLCANVNYGPFVAATERALAQVASLPQVQTSTYEVRLLRLAAIGLMAIWLVSGSGGGDIVYPLDPAPPGVNAGQAYTVADLLKAVLPLAQKRAGNKGPATTAP